MSVGEKSVAVCLSLDSVLKSVLDLVSDVAAKKDAAAILSENLPGLISALSKLSDIGDEAQNRQALDQTIALKVVELKRMLLPNAP